ncbi:uncharacterized [Tachysurus ichikawai]
MILSFKLFIELSSGLQQRRHCSLFDTKPERQSAVLAPNYVPRNSDLPRFEGRSDWSTARCGPRNSA